MVQDEVSQEFVRGVGDRRGIDDASVSASSDDESIHCFAPCLTRSVFRAFGRETDTQALRDSPDVEQHPAHDEGFRRSRKSLAAPSLGHRASLRASHINGFRFVYRVARVRASSPMIEDPGGSPRPGCTSPSGGAPPGVPTFLPHDLRHRRISLLHRQGRSWAEIGAFVAQRSALVTSDV